MAYVLTQPQLLAAAAADVAALGTTVDEAGAAAARATTGLASAAADEVSQAIAAVFNALGRESQAVIGQVMALQNQFAMLLATGGNSYAGTEASGVRALQTVSAGPYVTFVMDGSGTPTPPASFVANVVSRYLLPNFPAGLVQALSLPAGEYPDSGIKDLTQDISISRGVTILNNAIQQQLASGKTVNVLAYSQSANIASLEMRLLSPVDAPSSLPINFVLLGNSMNPNGGWDARFPGLSLPTLGFTTLGAAPSNTFQTISYTIEYDGWADFPQYPINIVSDLNALVGMVTTHAGYETLTAAQLSSAIVLPTQGPTTTTYYMIPSQHLPLVDPLRVVPIVGTPTADFLEPILRPVVNWGYGDPNYGWSTGPANVPTPFGFLPPLSDTIALGPALVSGFQQGVTAATNDVLTQGFPQLPSLDGLLGSSGTGGFALPTGPPTLTAILQGLQTANRQIVGGVTMASSTAYATLLPTADITVAALVSLPSYDVNLFLNGVLQMANGQPVEGLINALGTPIAADVGLLPFLAGLEVAVLGEAAGSIVTGTPYPST